MLMRKSRAILMAIVIVAVFQFCFWYRAIQTCAFNLGIRTAEIIESPMSPNDE